MKVMYHIQKDGTKVKISDLKTDHLINIIKMIIQKSKTGLKVRDDENIYGDEVLKRMHYESYINELARRG